MECRKVLITTFNATAHLAKCIENQTHRNFSRNEILCLTTLAKSITLKEIVIFLFDSKFSEIYVFFKDKPVAGFCTAPIGLQSINLLLPT